MKKSLLVILLVVILDGMGMGLIMPILPGLIASMSGPAHAASHYGFLLALYAAMQFLFSPILGGLSDRFGRRPILLISLAGAALDYCLMFFAPTMTLLYIGRIIAGITGANMAVATAYIADVTPDTQRPKAYGYMNACMGLGFVAGPAIGGLASTYLSARSPFLFAAALNALSFFLACIYLRESHDTKSTKVAPHVLNPFTFLKSLNAFKGLFALLTVFCMVNTIGQVAPCLWVLYLQDKFHWDGRMVGFSFAAFGILHALVQAFLTGPVTSRLGEIRTLLLGMCSDALGFILLACTTAGWMVFPVIPFLSIGGIAMPALQTLLSRQAAENQQGELQGILVSLMSLAAIVGPLFFTFVYSATTPFWIGTVWILASSLYVFCLPPLLALSRQRRTATVPASEEPLLSAKP